MDINTEPLVNAVIKSIQKNCIEIKITEPSDDFSDLERLKPILAGVDVIGLGEATHGTHEFFLLKHRLLRFLTNELGFTVLAFETPYPGCRTINSFITNGSCNAKLALQEQGYLAWRTEEILELLEWMRTYNHGAVQSRKIEFIGIDCQLDGRLVKNSLDFLKTYFVDSTTLSKVEQLFEEFLRCATPLDRVDAEVLSCGRGYSCSLRFCNRFSPTRMPQATFMWIAFPR